MNDQTTIEEGKHVYLAIMGPGEEAKYTSIAKQFMYAHPEIEIILITAVELEKKGFTPAKVELAKLTTELICKASFNRDLRNLPEKDWPEIRFNKQQNKLRERHHNFNKNKYRTR